ncbi:MAG: archease [Chlorobiales bacterium]|nr:archease [Chlorobiales bacterium]
MPYKLHEHTADIRLEATGESLAGLFSETMKAMNAVSCPGFSSEMVERRVEVSSPDILLLLVDFLNEIVFLGQVHHEAYEELQTVAVTETHFRGVVKGRKITGMEEEIKAVTLHEASVRQTEKGTWLANLVLDI